MDPGLRQQMQADLTVAMKARDRVRMTVLRTALAAVANAEAVDSTGPATRTGLLGDVERRLLSADDVLAIVTGERNELRDHAAEMHRLGQAAAAEELGARADILDGYLVAPNVHLRASHPSPDRHGPLT